MTEAAVGEAKGPKKKSGALSGLLARRKSADAASAKTLPTGYQPFSKKLAPGLIALGGSLAVAGALGAWIRTSQVVADGLQEEQVLAVMGHEADWGRLIAVVAAIAMLSSMVWLMRNVWLKLVSAAFVVGTIVLAVIRLPVINHHAAGLAYQARTGEIDFVSFHAGFGWGAWCLIVGAVALFLGLSAGILRELDVRRSEI